MAVMYDDVAGHAAAGLAAAGAGQALGGAHRRQGGALHLTLIPNLANTLSLNPTANLNHCPVRSCLLPHFYAACQGLSGTWRSLKSGSRDQVCFMVARTF